MSSLIKRLHKFSGDVIDFSEVEHAATLESALDVISTNELMLRRVYSMLAQGLSHEAVLDYLQHANQQKQQRVVNSMQGPSNKDNDDNQKRAA